jgi:hypothetical protein
VDCVCQRIVIDANTSNESATVTLVHDGSTTSLGSLQHNGRAQTEFPADVIGNVFSVRIASSTVDATAPAVEVFEVAFDIYNPMLGE